MITPFDGFEINPIHEGDSWKLCDFIVSNTDRIKLYFPKTLEQNSNPSLSQLYVQQKVKEFNQKALFLFTLKHSETRQLAGLIFIKKLDWQKKQGEFAYCIDYNFTGRKLASKALKNLIPYAIDHLGLERFQIIVHKSNLFSINVAKRCGFKWQKTVENGFISLGNQPIDVELYELHKN
ncbi:GNAT family protein [uncultured Psychroserpens sp.]|uniref:GNAT family N-acetyltransferase n=1 Tax=uncultured Psychroserpens sp. TaxID=255436 RepID=UPI0026132CD7|nr:GNAT family protein [uncultured Psychroserpens sp.]